MNVLMLCAEVAPFATVGGLSQVLYFLSKSLDKAGHDVRIFTPLHGKISKKKYKLYPTIETLRVPTDQNKPGQDTEILCSLKTYRTQKPHVYFLENREYFTLREHVFGYADDHQRFYLMSRACLEWLLLQYEQKGWMPDVIHVHDWHAGYCIELARRHPRYKDFFKHIPILYTVHNFRYQGNMDFAYLPPSEKDKGKVKLRTIHDEGLQGQNALLRGILYADWINTVSPSHAREVLTVQYGEGLEKFLLKKRAMLSGIINGLDTNAFDPAKDPLVAYPYSLASIEKRKLNKLELQHTFGLTQDPNIPLIAYSGRLDKQKGLHLLLEIIEDLIEEFALQFVILGGGDQQLANEFRLLQSKYPEHIGTHLYANFQLPRKIFSGADMMVIPSMFEPGGIIALECLRYGCIPIVRSTGGLHDVIQDFSPETKKGNGFSFVQPRATSLLIAITRALETYHHTKVWNTLVKNAMQEDYSWDTSMREYVKLYKKVLSLRRQQQSPNPSPAFIPA